jgi:hypothetical protein
MADAHVSVAPRSGVVRNIRVTTQRLDDVVQTLTYDGGIFLKIDVQGAEEKVLAGAVNAMAGPIKGIQLEMSVTTLYHGQLLANELDLILRNAGFALWDIVPGFRDPSSLRLLQYDGIYVRN